MACTHLSRRKARLVKTQHQHNDPDSLRPGQNLHPHPGKPAPDGHSADRRSALCPQLLHCCSTTKSSPLVLLLFKGTCQISLTRNRPPPLPSSSMSDSLEAGAGGRGGRLLHLERAFANFDPSAFSEIDSQIIRGQLAVASFNHHLRNRAATFW